VDAALETKWGELFKVYVGGEVAREESPLPKVAAAGLLAAAGAGALALRRARRRRGDDAGDDEGT
jgi:MYXO-CTERM domain-containing protein